MNDLLIGAAVFSRISIGLEVRYTLIDDREAASLCQLAVSRPAFIDPASRVWSGLW
jgi:hypothetical protein